MPIDLGALWFAAELQRAADRADLARVERIVAQHYAEVPQLRLEESRKAEAFLLVDVREAEEYAVSRLPGAIRIDPDASAPEALAAIAAHRAGRPVLFYCSVGVRSSEMADQLKAELAKDGAQVANLRGGIFRWAKDGLPMVAGAGGPTRAVHGYDATWAKLAPGPVVLDR